MKGFFREIEKEKGITLVALVVTIVILIILASITIASLTGDNGLLGKVGEAKEQTDLAGIREEVALIWNEVQMEIAGKGYNNKEIAEIFEEKLKENDPDASVTYQSSNNTFEVDYKDHMFEVQPSGELTSNREEVIKDIEDAWENIDKDQSDEDIAADLEEELQNKDENSTAEYNPETGNTDVNHGGYEAEVDEDGNVTIKGPEKDPNIDIDTDGDGEPDINIDTDGDGDPDINIDTDGDKKPDINIDTDDDGEPDINIDTDGDGDPDINIDTDGDGDPDINIDTDGDGDPDINIDTDDDGDPDINIDTDDDKDPDINIDTDGDKDPDINIDTDDDGDPDINIDTDDDGDPDINIDTDDDGDADINIDTDGDKDPDVNIDTDDDGDPDINIDTDDDGDADINIDTDGDKDPDVNIDTDDDGDADINIDTDGDKDPDINIDTDEDGDPDINIDTDGDKEPDVNIDTDGDGEPDINIDEDGDLVPDVDIDENEDKIPDKNVTKLTIVGQPQAIETISNASDVSFNVQVTGAASAGSIKEEKITYQWYYNTINSNEGGTPIENANSSTYTIGKDNVTPSISGRYYYCVVTQEYRGKTNVETTNAASLTVISPVEITSNPTSVQAVEGANDVTFEVTASGNGDISYQWYYKTSSEGAETQVIGATSSTYTIEKEEVTTELNGRYYYAKVIQSYGTAVATATSSEGLLTVAERANIIQEPSSTTVTEGKDAKFTVAAIGVGDISYQWYRNTMNSSTNGTPLDGETEETLTINNITEEDNDTYYYVVITQKYGTSTVEITSNVAKLTVGDGVSVSTPNDVNVIEGITDVTFSVEANGSGTFSYQWYRNTTDSNEGGTPIDTATGNSYTIRKEDVTIDLNNTYYYVEVTQNFGGNTSTVKSEPAALSVIAKATIGVQPNPVTAYEKGQNVIFSVEATGDGQLTYQWYKNTEESNEGGEAISSATGNSYTIGKENVTQDLNNTYYYVEITQKYGSSTVTVKTEAAQLTVMGTGIEASETDVTVYVNGTSKTVTLSGENAGAFSIETPANETYATAEINQDNNNELIITPVAAGETSVTVIEGNGGKTLTINITVLGTTIVADPQNVTAYVGGSNQTVALGGENSGTFTIETEPEATVATASISGNILTIKPVGVGSTSVTVKELNGNKTTTVNVEVKETSIDANNKDVTLYVGGAKGTVTITGTELGTLSIEKAPDGLYATAEINPDNNKELIITPVGAGSTNVVVKEGNGNNTVTININVLATTITASPESVIAYVDGSNQTVTLSGENAGAFSIEKQPEGYATASIQGNTLTIEPKAAGKTSVTVREANGGKTVEIPIEVRQTSIGATSTDITAYVGGADQNVSISGTYMGELSISKEPEEGVATVSLGDNNVLTIHPVGEGQTSVEVKEANGNKTITINIRVIRSNMTATSTNVTAYVGGTDQTVEIQGIDIGELSISKEPEEGVATVNLQGSTLTIKPVGDGKTSVEVKEANGNNTVTINITVITPSITEQTVEVYAGGASKQVTITGLHMGTLTIEEGPDSTYATASIEGTTLTVVPTQTAGNTSLLLKEANGNQTARINITVIATGIDASEKDLELYVGGANKQVEISGTNAGELSVSRQPDTGIATASLSGNILTITPKAAGSTNVVVKEANGNKTVTININVLATTITASPESVIAYVNGTNQTVTLGGENAGTFSIEKQPESYATASIQGNTLTIEPKSAGTTSVTVREANGNQTKEIPIEVRQTSIEATNTNVTAYVGGSNQEVEITGTYLGELSIETPADESYAKVSLEGNTLTIEPKAVGKTSVTIKEGNGNRTVTININVIASNITVDNPNVTAYVGGSDRTATISGDSLGALSISGNPNSKVATASLSGNTITIKPVGEGETSVTVREANGNKTVTVSIKVLATSINAQSIEVYAGGTAKTVTITGQSMGTLTIEEGPDSRYATAQINGTSLTVTPVAAGSTKLTLKEANGNQTATINITVTATSIDADNKDVTLYVGGNSKTVTISGENTGAFSIERQPNEGVATASIQNNILTIVPKAAGSTSVVVKEGNGNKTVTINVTVLATTITANPESVIAYVNGTNQTVTLGGENAGAFSIEKQPEGYATASIQGNTLTIEPKAAGKTSVTVREANGGKTVEIPIEVRQTSIGATSTDITAYVGGADQNVSISGTYMGELSISKEPEEGVATVSLGDNNVLTIHPVGEGQTSVEVKEANGNKTITINIRVIRSNMTATSTNVTAYVGGTDQTVEIQGTDIGDLSISKEPEEGVATASLQGNTLTIKPVGDGKTSVEVKEANGNKTVTINITVITPSITEQTVEVYAGGASKQVTITGLHMGTLTIEEGPDSTYATASIEGTTLTVVPTQTAGNTSLLLKEANGNQTARINITVIATGIDASEKDLELYVGGANKQVEINGTNAGELSISRQPDTGIATASLSGNILTITPKAAGTTSVVVKEANGNKTVTININVLATTITASPESVIAYVNGTNQTVTLGGENAGAFSIEKQPESYATASIQGNTLTIEPKSAGTTSVTVREANGNQTKEIPIEVRQTSIEATNTNVTAYVGGSNQEVEITGTYLGELSIETPADESYAKVSLEGNTLTIEPKAVGKTSVTIKEGNGNRTVTININVIASNITVDNPNVTAYVGGSDRTATISGDSLGALSISGNPNSKVATASLSGNTITIKPVGEGETSVTVREANGNKTITVNITVLATSINTQSIEVYAGGTAKTVTITGQSMGTLTIEEGPDSRYATAQINGTSLTVTPVAAGSTKLTLKEANGNQTATINITVTATSIDANNKDVTLYVGGNSKTVTISGENTGAFSIERQPNEGVATASIQNNILTIVPKAAGSTSVVVKEGNGNKTVTINVTVLATTITANPESVIAYVNGTNQTVTLGGENAGAFSIEKQPEGYATASIQGNTLTIEPKAAGKTSVTVREANGGKTVEIPIEVRQTSIGATNTNVTAYVGGSNQEVTITGTYLGNLSIEKQPTASIATVSLDGTTLTIIPKAAGDTSVVVKEGNGNRTVTINIHVIQSNITATSTSVTGYVGGVNQTVTIQGTDIGTLSIEAPPTETVATASLQGNTLTIKPVGDGKTSVTVKEANGNNTVTIEITVLATSITPQSIEVYEGGVAKTVEIQGLNMGALEITTPPEEGIATAQISGTSLTVTPVKAGNTELTLKEANGNQTTTISITVTATSIDANSKDVTVYVGGDSKTVEITGENAGTLSIGTPADGTHATASLQGNIVTISPVAAGTTSVTIKEGNGNKTVTINIEVKATSIDANNKNVLAYVGGNKQTVTITGTEMGELSISGQPNTSYATAELQGSTLTITPVSAGKTSVTVREANGKQTVTINIEVRATSIDANNKNVTAYVGGVNPQVTITGTEMGTLSIEKQADGAVATVSLDGTTLTITPKAAGKTSVTVKEGNGNKTVTINITVLETTLEATSTNVTAYVGGVNPQITITGTNAGAFSIETPADGVHATAELRDGILTITPKAEGETSVTIKEGNGNKTVTINITVLETTLEATNTNVIAYLGGTNPQVTIRGENTGTLNIVKQPDNAYAKVSLQGGKLTITPVVVGKTSVTIKEANGNKEVTINIEVKATSMTATNTNVIAYVGGANPQVTINGDNLGTLSIVTPSTETIARTSLQGRTLTITPVAAGKTSVKIKEGNGNKEVTINIEVRQTSMTATSTNVTAYVGGSNQEVTITGTYLGNLSIEEQPTASVATVSLEGTKLIIHPVGKGTTNVTIKEANGNKLVTINIEVIESTLTATSTNVTLYVGGGTKQVTINGDNVGTLSVSGKPTGSVATASLQGSTLTIAPVGAGSTNVVVKEGNGNKTVTIKITVLATSIIPQSIELYAGGTAKTVTIQGLNMGTLTIENGPDTTKATASISGTSLTVTPVAAGTTSLTLKEANGNKTATISITVLATSIEATPNSLSVNVSDGVQTVQLSGTNAGTFSIVTGPNSAVATAQISGSMLTITPVGKGETSVVVKEENGNKQTTISITVSAGVSAPDIPKADYGAIVNGYDCSSEGVNNWLLFYADDENIYLIADDYIPYENIPESSGGNKPIQSRTYPRAAFFDSVVNDYSGSSSITDPRLQALNNDYFTKNYSSSYDNMKAVAYMMDTNAWSGYAGEHAEYAIGGPSIELLFKSYNQKYGTNYVAEATNNSGYNIHKYLSNKTDPLYVKTSTTNALAYWVASTASATNANYVLYVRHDGDIGYYFYDIATRGFRPLVCLKSDTKLEKNDDGSYTIVEPPKNNNIDPETDYGAIVKGYECESEGVDTWRIFYADYEHVYLIADDYIPYENIPSNSAGHKPDKGSSSYPRAGYFIAILSDYSGSSSITDPDIKALNNDYFTKNYSSSNYNMKAVAYMLDTNAWSGFAGEKAEYAVGGPSIEMLMKSYSERYGVSYTSRAETATGYQISTNGGSTWKDYMTTSSEYLKTSDRTYVISSKSNASGYWVASPSASATNTVMYVDYCGYVSRSDYTGDALGFRPLVCLKSDVTLQKNSDGSYTIVGGSDEGE